MKTRFFSGMVVAILGLLIILVPVWIFPPCSEVIETAAGNMRMKCFWSGQAEIGIGFLILCGGALLIVFKSPLIRLGLSVMLSLIGVLGILIPTLLIGGCEMATMPCRMTTFPALIILNLLMGGFSAANALHLWRQNKKP